MTGMRVNGGYFGDISLDGVKWVGMFAWPKAIHEGGGEAFVVIDPAAGEAQRNALLTILTGGETEPGATIFNVFATVIETLHPPAFLPIEFELDPRQAGRQAQRGRPDRHDDRRRSATRSPGPSTGAKGHAAAARLRIYRGGVRQRRHPGDRRGAPGLDLDHAHVAMLDLHPRRRLNRPRQWP